MMTRRLAFMPAAALLGCGEPPRPTGIVVEEPSASLVSCTEVIGSSQTAQWFTGTLEGADERERATWQLRSETNATLTDWSDPEFEGWARLASPPCGRGSAAPGRVILVIGGPFGTDTAAWQREIRRALPSIRERYPAGTVFSLQPEVGGPRHARCQVSGGWVVSSISHPAVDYVIGDVTASGFSAGASPEVAGCNEFLDTRGRLVSSAAVSIGRSVLGFYGDAAADPLAR